MTMAIEKTLKSYENCCRTCLKEETSFDIFMETLNNTNLADILISCTRLNIQQEDCLPKKMCGCCYNCLVSFYNFRELALKVDARLRENISNSYGVNNSDDDNKSDKYPFEIIVENNIDGNYCTLQPKAETDYGDIEGSDENRSLDIFTDTNIFPEPLKLKSTKKEKLECTYCKKTFRKLSRLKDHLVKHNILKNNNDNTYNESINHQETEGTYSLTEREDVNNTIVQSLVEYVSCRICSRKFKSTNSLSAHMRKHVEKGRVISCLKCGKVFKKISHLKRHEIVHDSSRLYKCSVCPRSFQSAEVFKGHMNKHNGIKPHNCPLCTKSFANLTTLKSHIKMHNKDKFLCPTCGKKFDSSTSLDQHVKRHLGLKQFECTLCPRKFVSKGELKSHTITHTGERWYTCSQCGGTFTKQSSLSKHKLRHLGIKPHQCDTCLMKFSSKDHLKRHIRIHTGEKPYKCDICERAFTQSNDLVKHRRAHLGEKIYKCTECSESFRLHIELRQHISEHYISSQLQMLDKNNKDNMEVSREDTNNDNIVCVQIDSNNTNK